MPTSEEIELAKKLKQQQLEDAYKRGDSPAQIAALQGVNDEFVEAGSPPLESVEPISPIMSSIEQPSMAQSAPAPMMSPAAQAMGGFEQDAAAVDSQRPDTEQEYPSGWPDRDSGPAGPVGLGEEPMQLPSPDELPDEPMPDPVLEQVAAQRGDIEANYGGDIRRSEQDVSEAMRAQQDAAAGRASDPGMAQRADAMDSDIAVLSGRVDLAKLAYDEARAEQEQSKIATIQERGSLRELETQELEASLKEREEMAVQSSETAAASLANVNKEYEEFRAMKVDPDRAMNNMSAGRKISFVLLAGLGGVFRAAMRGGGITPSGPSVADTAIVTIREIIKRDIAAQNVNIRKQGIAVDQAYKMDASVRRNLMDDGARLKASQALRWRGVKSKIDARTLKATDADEIANLKAMSAAVDVETAEADREAKVREQDALEKKSQWDKSEQTAQRFLISDSRTKDTSDAQRRLTREIQAQNIGQRRQAAGAAAGRADRTERRMVRGETRAARKDLLAEDRYAISRVDRDQDQETKHRREMQDYNKVARKDFTKLARLNSTIELWQDPEAPGVLERARYRLGGPLISSDKTSTAMRGVDEEVLRLVKEITGVAGRPEEAARIEGILMSKTSSAKQIVEAMQDVRDLLLGSMTDFQKGYPGAEKMWPIPGVRVKAQQQQQEDDLRQKMADRPPLRP